MGKVGHPRNFKTPEDLWTTFVQYRDWVEKNPIRKMVFVGKDGNKEWEDLPRPLTNEGFGNFCWEKGYGETQQYFINQDGFYDEYISICRTIKAIIRQHQIEGGMAGIYNPSITQRLNGLTEKQEVKHDGGLEIKIKRV